MSGHSEHVQNENDQVQRSAHEADETAVPKPPADLLTDRLADEFALKPQALADGGEEEAQD